jgi:hypothetical protein
MSDALTRVYQSIDEQHSDLPASTRRAFITKTGASLGAMGLLGVPAVALATKGAASGNDPQTILNIAATAEVLATIVNTVGWERGLGGDRVTQRNLAAAAREELIHFQVLTSKGVGAVPLTKKIWIPDAVFANRRNFLSTLEVGDQIFCNAYLIGTITFGNAGNGQLAAIASEFMGVEAVHRALARQSLGKLGNDRAFVKFDQVETAPDAPNRGQPGFDRIEGAVQQLQAAGFGFGAPSKAKGRFYHFDPIARRTPDDPDVNTRTPDAQ